MRRSSRPGFETVSKIDLPVSLICQYLSGETLEAVGPFYLVSMPVEVKDHPQGNEKKYVVDSTKLFYDRVCLTRGHSKVVVAYLVNVCNIAIYY